MARAVSAASPSRLDLVAVGWGGLAASVGLMAGASRDWPLRLAASAVSFAVGGLLCGIRAGGRRRAHAVAAWAAAYLIDGAFVIVARALDAAGGPAAPALVPGGRGWLVAAAWSLAFCLAGAQAADAWLRPAGSRAVG
jgi:hypothetical protein